MSHSEKMRVDLQGYKDKSSTNRPSRESLNELERKNTKARSKFYLNKAQSDLNKMDICTKIV